MSAPVDVTVAKELAKLFSWKHLMSYNESYFGEPEGELKATVYAIERLMPDAYRSDEVAELIEAVSQVYGGEEHADKESCAPGCMSCRIQIAVARCLGESE